jgi:hypothetical protein
MHPNKTHPLSTNPTLRGIEPGPWRWNYRVLYFALRATLSVIWQHWWEVRVHCFVLNAHYSELV